MASKYSNEFIRFFGNIRIFAKLCGVDFVADDYCMNWITWGVVTLLNVSIGLTIYTMYVQKTWVDVIECLCMFCAGIHAYAKLINGIKNKHMMHFLYVEAVGIYTVYEHKTHNYQQHLKESLRLIKYLIQILAAMIAVALLIVVGLAIFYQVVFNERIHIMALQFPFVDYETDFGYYFNSVFHVIAIVFGAVGNFINDSWCFIFAAHIPLIKNILQVKFKELDEMLLEEDKKQDIKIKELLLDIFKWHQKYLVYCSTVKTLFFWVIFVQVAMEFVSIACTIVCMFLGVWPAAPVFLFYSFALFYFLCALGNIVELANDDVILMIYDCRWYQLTIPQQKMILIMLRHSQQAEGMSIGGVAPLSLHTALQLTKTIYTFSMMLKNFLN